MNFTLTIDGRGLAGGKGTIDVLDPATEGLIATAPAASAEDLDLAVTSAAKAFAAWRDTPLPKRQATVRRLGQCLRDNLDELAILLTREQGKPLASARMDILSGAMWCDGMAGLNLPVEIIEDNDVRRVESHRTPIGVVAAIAPWNFPVGLAFWKIAPALVAGNAVVLKPSPYTPLTTLRIGELVRGMLPPGVLNIVSGGDELGPMLTAHPGIDKISFTGSTETGRKVMRTAADDLKRVTLELGGNDAAIILPDARVEDLIEQLFWAAFRNSGQFCVAAKRIYVHESLYDRFADALVKRAQQARVGNGLDPDTDLGPIQNRVQFEKVSALIARCKQDGLTLLSGGEPPSNKGFFIAPTVISNPPDDAEIVTEEPFGPIVPLLKYATVEEAIRRANDSPYGLAASVWGEDPELAAHVASQLEAGTVWINDIHIMSPQAPFGGHKQSGIGVENGLHGLLEYTNSKTVVTRKPALQAALIKAQGELHGAG